MLLLGTTGCGKKAMTRLAAFTAGSHSNFSMRIFACILYIATLTVDQRPATKRKKKIWNFCAEFHIRVCMSK